MVAGLPGIYIHIPFCERKCTYCNFNTTDFDKLIVPPYIDAVAREIAYWGDKLAQDSNDQSKAVVDTIYFGGGTPSIVDAVHIQNLIAACKKSFEVAPEAEITIEINPGTFRQEKMEAWLEAGVNRASVGVQSFIDRELQSLSRTHTSDDARRTVELLRRSGFSNISLDLIAGLPEQTLEDWEHNLESALDLEPEHLSLYLLEIKEGTQLSMQVKRELRPAPDEDVAAEMYELIRDFTSVRGFEHYEISNFGVLRDSRKGPSPFRSKHNMKYWTGAPFYAMGCGGHSYDGTSRWTNIKRTESYIESVLSRGQGINERTPLSERDRAVEALFMGLRLKEGIDLEEFRSLYLTDAEQLFGEDLDRLEEAGLIERLKDRLKLTRRGFLLSNEVFVAFV